MARKKKLPPGITLRSDGRYQGRVQYNGEKYALYSRNLAELKKQMTDLKYELQHGTYIKKSDITLDDWFQTWIETYKKPSVKQGTVETYREVYSAHLKKPLGKMKLSDIRGEHLQKLLNDVSRAGFSDSIIKQVCAVLSGSLKQAYKSQLIPKNPYELISKPKGKAKKEKVVFTREQQELFMQYSEKSYLRNFFQLAICTGMRIGELGGLQWNDIDFKDRVIHVRHTLAEQRGGGWRLDTPKTKTSLRDIPMIGKAYEILRQQEKEYKAYQGNVVPINKGEDFVFSVMGEPISQYRAESEIRAMLQNMAADGVDFPYFTMHCTRHTFATRCIESGMTPQVLKTILGHSSLAMTMDLYSHVLPDTKAEEMEKIASAF